ncbi:MAG TPA: sce7726 family protein [Thermoleophilaceae bacterium]|nr:sce7726 family protein [Thermoleophilaceae bacterium]
MRGCCSAPEGFVLREPAIRAGLRPVALSRAASSGARVIEEFWIPGSNARADLAVVGSSLEGYEIKSAADSLKRLPAQVSAFSRVFDRCTAVVASRHEPAVYGLLPPWWGVLVLESDSEAVFSTGRVAHPNPEIDIELVVRLLWRDEVQRVLVEHGVQPDLAGGRSAMWKQLLDSLSPAGVRSAVRKALGSRDHWLNQHGQPRLSPALAPAR